MKIVFSTKNKGKLIEMKSILDGFEIISAEEAGVLDDIVEDGNTFAENALKKARYVNSICHEWTIADDSGLCIDALNGQPGLMTARWVGENANGDELINFTLKKMTNVPYGHRAAYFESAAALVAPDGQEWIFVGRMPGKITEQARGVALPKLPYDVIFQPDGEERTFAEMNQDEKNSISHRGLAFKKLKEFLINLNK